MMQQNLTPAQEHVLAAVSGGATLQAAAQAAQVHRNIIAYWRRTSIVFREALSYAQYDKAMLIREEAESAVAEAYATLRGILNDPKASPSVRLNAAKYILEKASTPPPPDPLSAYHVETVAMSVDPVRQESMHKNAQSNAQTGSQLVHKNAQSDRRTEPPIMHKNAQTPRAGRGPNYTGSTTADIDPFDRSNRQSAP